MASGRGLKIWTLVTLVATLLITRVGLLDQLGYDFSVVIAALLGVSMPQLAALRISDLRNAGKPRHRLSVDFVLATYTQIVGAGVVLLLVPLMVLLVRGLWQPHCDLATGLLWYLLIPGVTCLYAAALGLFFAFATRRVRSALITSYLFILLTLALALRHVVADPPVFFFNGVIGYFPGPIYDEKVAITGAMIWARAGTIVWTALFLAAAAATCDLRRVRLDPALFLELDLSFGNLVPRAAVLVCVMAIGGLHLARHANGTSPNAGQIQRTLGGKIESDNFTIYFDRDTKTSADIQLMVEDHEFRLAQLLDYLGWDGLPEGKKLTSYVYPSREMKKRLMGAGATSYADPWNRAMHLNDEGFPHATLDHEMAHLLSSYFAGWLGFSTRMGLHEGFAVAADWEQPRLTPDQWARAMKAEGLLPEMRQLLSAKGFWSEASTRAYLAAGSFVRFLIDRRGIEPFIPFFTDGDSETHYGVPIDTLVAEWQAMLDTLAVNAAEQAYAYHALARGPIFARRCPRQTAQIAERAGSDYARGRYLSAEAEFERLLEWAPDDPSYLVGQTRTLLRLERPGAAATIARRITREGRGQLVDVAHDILSDIHWNAGRADSARHHLEAVIQSGASEDLVRAAHAKLAVLDSDDYRRVLADAPGAAERAAILARLTIAGPERGLARYLLGRQLYHEGAWREAEAALAAAVGDTLPDPSIRMAGLWLLGETRYRLDEIGGALTCFESIAKADRYEAEVIRAESWIDRCLWAERTRLP